MHSRSGETHKLRVLGIVELTASRIKTWEKIQQKRGWERGRLLTPGACMKSCRLHKALHKSGHGEQAFNPST